MTDSFPKITVITPSFNQSQFLERTILSVIKQDYPNLEYIIIDGGSTDGSVDIIKQYEEHINYWVSEKDNGQTHALNKGLKIATGDWVGWQNSDDIYYPGSFLSVADAINNVTTEDLVIGNMNLIDEHDSMLRDLKYVTPTYKSLLAEGMVVANQAAFWRRKIHDDIGYLDEDLHCVFDYEWFLRVMKDKQAYHVDKTWGALRYHSETKTHNIQKQFDVEMNKVLGGRRLTLVSKLFQQLRRMVLMILGGHIKYVFRGVRSRLKLG